MKLYHGTSREKKEEILKEGFRTDTDVVNGKHFGNFVYFTPDKKQAEDFGEVILEVELDETKLFHIPSLRDFNQIEFQIHTSGLTWEKHLKALRLIGISLVDITGEKIVMVSEVKEINIVTT